MWYTDSMTENDWNHRVHPENTTPAEPNDWQPKPGPRASTIERITRMTFVILQPNSNTNATDKYMVVDADEWTAYVNGAVKFASVAGRFNSYAEAEKLRDRINYYD